MLLSSSDGVALLAVTSALGTLGAAGSDLANNVVFMSAFWSWLAAQVMKIFTAFYREGKWDYKVGGEGASSTPA